MYINVVRVGCYIIMVHSCLQTAVNAFLIETDALVDKLYVIFKFFPLLCKIGYNPQIKGFAGEANKNVEDTFLFIANKLFEQTKLTLR